MDDDFFPSRVTLSDVLSPAELELRLVSGHQHCRSLPVRGAHLTEILDPGRWLDHDWIMITTGLQLHRDAGRQRWLIRELADKGITALGYGLGIVTKNVPSALLDEARRLGYPLFTVPLHIPVRLVITHVNRLLLATDEELFHRAVTLHDYLLAGLDSSARSSLAPETHLVTNLEKLLGLQADYLDVTGRPVGARQDPEFDLAPLLNSASKQSTTKLRVSGAELLAVPCALGTRLTGWLVVHLPSTMETGQSVLAATQATAKLLAVAVVSRQHSTENLNALGQELMAQLLDSADEPQSRVRDELEALGQTRALPVLHQLGFSAGDPIRALVVAQVRSDQTVARLRATLRESKLPHLSVARDEEFFAAVQGTGDDVRRIAAGFGRYTGVGGSVPSIAELHRSMRQARFALGTIEQVGPPTYLDFDTLPLAPWMAEQARETAGDQRVGQYVDPLLEQPLLLEAVVQYLRHDQDIPAAARSLHLHPNSLRYRLDRAESTLGVPLRRPSVLASLYLALTANRLL